MFIHFDLDWAYKKNWLKEYGVGENVYFAMSKSFYKIM